MATKVLKNAKLVIGAKELKVKSVTINYSVDSPEKTQMGDDTHIFAAGGLKNWDMSFELNNDYADNTVDEFLFDNVGVEQSVYVWPEDAATSANNPKYHGLGFISAYSPMSGATGDIATTPLSIVPAGNLQRAVAD